MACVLYIIQFNGQEPVAETLANEGKRFEVKEEVDHCIREHQGVRTDETATEVRISVRVK